MVEKTNINLVQLYSIINSKVAEGYYLRDFFWDAFNRLEKEELEEMGINTEGYDDSTIIREVIFEIYSAMVINNIIDNYNSCKS